MCIITRIHNRIYSGFLSASDDAENFYCLVVNMSYIILFLLFNFFSFIDIYESIVGVILTTASHFVAPYCFILVPFFLVYVLFYGVPHISVVS